MSDLGPRYEHKEIEENIYRKWEESGCFNPDKLTQTDADRNADRHGKIPHRPASSPCLPAGRRTKSAFTIMMPPPNANGSLHMGHAVFVTLEDIMTRYWRMKGRKTLWLPGADHAGFETQVVFDKKLDKEGRNRFAIDRETLWQEIWDFTQVNKKVMEAQLRRLGASCDWSRETFTLDPKIIGGVYATFEKMYREGLVYRAFRVINWCPKHRTALSDLEVKYVERVDPLYYIKYGPLTLATVRPETKFGDTALAVNPKDKRYRKYIGKEIRAKGILGDLKFKVVADEAVDPKFGTGVVKVTPAHDAVDFEIWKRHEQEIAGPKIIIDESGRLTGEVGEFKGLKVAEARGKVVEKMKEIGILLKMDSEYKHQVATCYKCNSTLEPMPKPQWFVKMEPLAKPAIKAVESGKIKFHPESSRKVCLHWLKNIHDWNISRQIIWGIRIPAWFCLKCGEAQINIKTGARWYLVRHGETDSVKNNIVEGWQDTPLNDTGLAQAETSALNLKNKKVDLIISSDLKRSKQTAEIISRETGAKIIYDPELRERNWGELEGVSKAERDLHHQDSTYSYEGKSKKGESLKELEARAWSAFQKYLKLYPDKNIVFTIHGGPIRLIMGKLKNWSLEEVLRYYPLPSETVTIDLHKPCPKCKGIIYEQDPDVFDTWFSSGQWPYLTLLAQGRNSKSQMTNSKQGLGTSKDFEDFYPTDVLETAYDILFFWVMRMIMLGLYRTGKIPFKTVYLHGLVRDKDRQKMSKSKGNVVDPLGVAEEYGTDAVRMALTVGNTAGQDIVISEDKIRAYRNFATKLWNIARFVIMQKEKAEEAGLTFPKMSPRDKKIVEQARKVRLGIGKKIEGFQFHLGAEQAYHYIWHTFADKIIESAKPRLASEKRAERESAYLMLLQVLRESLIMLHPFMPFVTEQIYDQLPKDNAKTKEPDLLIIHPW
ncbi:MAG TPA: class I tRNA ligase family protein [Candidatus Paceibacterota bacterium]